MPDFTYRIAPADAVRSHIAGLILGGPASPLRLGAVSLHAHQLSAVTRLEAAIERFNGAMLCDDVGMGKTYVAIAVARRFAKVLVVIPAALAPMWHSALSRTGMQTDLITFEALSRADSKDRPTRPRRSHRYDLVIVDEAHHARNPRTNRYLALESLVRGAKVLLLTATPIHNRRDDLVAVLSLFLGSRAVAMTSAELALCVIRREQKQLKKSLPIPTVRPIVFHELPDSPAIVDELMNLPPPVPLRGGGVGGTLIGRGLVHQWASSEAALNEAVRRRVARAVAMCASLEAGTYPTAAELETWIYGDGALQLGFAEILAAPILDRSELLDAVRAHLTALERVRTRFSQATAIDAERSRTLTTIRQNDPQAKIVAFAQYSETVSMLFRRLTASGGIAMLTSHGARVAGGPLTRSDAICRFAPRATYSPEPAAAEAIDLLLTTDILSEGVNLQDARMVIHLDIPWTAARMEQRVGRVARLGSRHLHVDIHALRPPRSAAAVLSTETIVERKWRIARLVVGTAMATPAFESIDVGRDPESTTPVENTPAKTERLRSILQSWISDVPRTDLPALRNETVVASVEAAVNGFVALVSLNGAQHLVAGSHDRVSDDLATQIEVCGCVTACDIPTKATQLEDATALIQSWIATQTASSAAGLSESSAPHRRAAVARIDGAIESAPPQLRASRLAMAARARRVATAPLCAAAERDLANLLRSDLADGEWLAAIAGLETTMAQTKISSSEPSGIHALLLLTKR